MTIYLIYCLSVFLKKLFCNHICSLTAGTDDASTVPVTPATATGHNKSYIVG